MPPYRSQLRIGYKNFKTSVGTAKAYALNVLKFFTIDFFELC